MSSCSIHFPDRVPQASQPSSWVALILALKLMENKSPHQMSVYSVSKRMMCPFLGLPRDVSFSLRFQRQSYASSNAQTTVGRIGPADCHSMTSCRYAFLIVSSPGSEAF